MDGFDLSSNHQWSLAPLIGLEHPCSSLMDTLSYTHGSFCSYLWQFTCRTMVFGTEKGARSFSCTILRTIFVDLCNQSIGSFSFLIFLLLPRYLPLLRYAILFQ